MDKETFDRIRKAVGYSLPIFRMTPYGMKEIRREAFPPHSLRHLAVKLNRERAEAERLESLKPKPMAGAGGKPKAGKGGKPKAGAGGKQIDTHYTGAIAFRRAKEAEEEAFREYSHKVVNAQAELRDRLYREGFHTGESIAHATTELGRKMMNVKYPIDTEK